MGAVGLDFGFLGALGFSAWVWKGGSFGGRAYGWTIRGDETLLECSSKEKLDPFRVRARTEAVLEIDWKDCLDSPRCREGLRQDLEAAGNFEARRVKFLGVSKKHDLPKL